MKKRIIAMILSIVMVIGMLPVTVFAADVVASGYCGGEGDGTNLTWELDSSGVLTISGTGAMEDYPGEGSPWYNKRSSLKTVVINDGVTYIGEAAFYGCDALTSVSIPNSVTSIKSFTFYRCASLTSITVGDENPAYQDINGVLFSNDGKTLICYPAGKMLSSYQIPDGLTYIEEEAFSN